MDLPPIFDIVSAGDVDAIADAIAAGANPNATHPTVGQTLLYNACALDDTTVVEALIAHGADPNLSMTYRSPVDGRIEKGLVALMMCRSKAATKAMLAGGANPNAATSIGVTALMRAAQAGKAEVVSLLLDHGADPQAVDSTGANARDYAQRKIEKFKKIMNRSPVADLEQACERFVRVKFLLPVS